MPAACTEPSASKQQHIHVPVIVVVALHHVEPAEDADDARRVGVLGERAVFVVQEQLQLRRRVIARDEKIEITVEVEILDDDAPREAESVEASASGNVVESREICVRCETLGRDQEVGWDFLRIIVDGHVSDVQEPLAREIGIGPRPRARERFEEIADGAA